MIASKKLILIVDMLKGFIEIGLLSSPYIKKLVPKIKEFLQSEKEIDNIFVCDSHSIYDLEMKVYPAHCLKNTIESEIDNDLKPYAKQIVLKTTTNSFFELNLKEIETYDTIEIVGCCTDICILQLALNLKTYFNKLNMDKQIVVFKDLVDTFDNKEHKRDEFHDFALKLMKNSGILIKNWK